ncbi:MAG TPA: family 10 glycosylhydrolase [Verrucomicrobiae bacterium]|jgi:uncharacterized lipoprotein YddW (UPF0748 family)
MKRRIKFLSALVLFLPAMLFAANFIYQPAAVKPPNPPREFRGAWITEVATNQDWPSKPGLSVAEQKAELVSLLDRAVQLHLNAIILQVRPECDAMYASPIEPWSEYLTGTMGKAPQPFYDPLAFAIEEAHKRGLELHAWFNPFRALLADTKSPVALNHISRTHPELVRKYGDQLWLDPGEPVVRQYVLRVVMDVVKRYDVDGVQFDDYFYPYPEKDSAGRVLDFPDYATWEKYGLPNGYDRASWRRQNINQFIQAVYQNIKAVKPWVKFGVSPFGIWRPGFPKQIRGLDAYASLYADTRLWLANGWLDYFSPQLYWPVDDFPHSFPALLGWWSSQNIQGRNLWPGLSTANVGEKFSANEIARQIQITRAQSGAGGEIFFHLKNLTDNPALAAVIRNAYPQPALVPASPWLDSFSPDKPRLAIVGNTGANVQVRWENSGGEPAWLWVLQSRATNSVWTTEILPASRTNYTFENSSPDIISIHAVNRAGNLSPPAALKKTAPVHNGKVMLYD